MRRIFLSLACLLSPFFAMGQQYTITGVSRGGQYVVEVQGIGTAEQYSALQKYTPTIAEDYLLSMLDEDFPLAIYDYCNRILADDAVVSKMQQFKQTAAKSLLDEILKYQGQGIVGKYENSGDKATSVVRIVISSGESIISLMVEKMMDAVVTSGNGNLQADFVRHIFTRVAERTLSENDHQIKTMVER